MTYVNLISLCSLLLIIQKGLCQIAVVEEKAPRIVHDNFYKAALNVKEHQLKNELIKLIGEKTYLVEKLKLMEKHKLQHVNSTNIIRNEMDETRKQIAQKIKEIDLIVAQANHQFDFDSLSREIENKSKKNMNQEQQNGAQSEVITKPLEKSQRAVNSNLKEGQ